METKANYVLIGLFTLAGIAGALGLLLWLAKVEVDRQYAYYDILFADVSGLGTASDVRYNGLPVGQVVDLGLDEADSSQVRVRIEVSADTPVNTETVAKLQSQGVTGVSFVGLSGGSATSTALADGSEIPSERTALQTVFEGAPVVLDRAVELLENVNDVFDSGNRDAVSDMLDNLASASARIDTVLEDFESLSGDLGSAAREIASFTERLDAVSDTAETTLRTATGTLETANVTVARVGDLTTQQLVPLAEDLRTASQTANRVIDDVGGQARAIAGRIDELAVRGSEVLDDAGQTLETANQTFTSATTAIEGITAFTASNLVPLSDDLRTTTQTANRVIADAGTEIERIAGRIDGLAERGEIAVDAAVVALDDVQITVRDARTTVARANTYIDEQLTPLTRDLRETT
ncbi:MAG: MlaD family protein, partial [Pseudomonadota bacterium]